MAAVPSTGGFSAQYYQPGSSNGHYGGAPAASEHRSNGGSGPAGGSGSGHSRRVTSQSSVASSTYTTSSSTARGSVVGSGSGAAAHMESTVTKLLVATKQLLEGLTDWSQGKISEEQVSDIYVRLGNCFNAAVSAFTKEGISMKDLKEVPAQLRTRLEAAINEEASTATLNEHLPKIRPIILDLLRGLREKQDQHQVMLAARAERERSMSTDQQLEAASGPYYQQQAAHLPRQSSTSGSSGRPRQPSSGGSIQQSRSREDLQASANERASPAPGLGSSRASHSQQSSQYSNDDGQSHPVRRPSQDGSLSGRRTSNTPRPGSIVKSRSSSSLRASRPGMVDGGPPPGAPEAPLPPLPPVSGAPTGPARSPLPLPGHQQSRLVPPESSNSATPPLPRISTTSATPQGDRSSTPSPTSNKPNPSIFTPPRSTLRPTGQGQHLPLPPLPLSNDDAPLEALKKADPLARRASKRFSQYTFNKMSASQSMIASPSSSLGGSSLGPGSSKSPGRDRDDSAKDFVNNGGRMEEDAQQGKVKLSRKMKGSASPRMTARGEEEPPVPALPKFSFSPDGSWGLGAGGQSLPSSLSPTDKGKKRVSMVAEETEDQLEAADNSAGASGQADSAPRPGSVSPKSAPQERIPAVDLRPPEMSRRKSSISSVASSASQYSTVGIHHEAHNQETPPPVPPIPLHVEPPTPTPNSPVINASSPISVPHRTIFLQLGRDMKKARLEVSDDISFTSLKMLFTDKFAYNPGLADFPAIYLRDPISGVQYELEDLDEIKDHSVLSLNIEPLDQVKQHIDEGMAALARDLKELKTTFNREKRVSTLLGAGQLSLAGSTPAVSPGEHKVPTDMQVQVAAQKVLEMKRKLPNLELPNAASKEAKDADSGKVAVMSPSTSVQSSASDSRVMQLAGDLRSSYDEIQSVRREVGALRQVYLDFRTETSSILGTLRSQTDQVKNLAQTQVAGSRAFIDTGKGKLDAQSQDLLTKIEELQDNIDDLKNDVTTRRIKPKPKQMETIKASISSRHRELEELGTYIATVKPMWKKTWEAELQNIVEEQQLLNHQEELLSDLRADHENVQTIFDQIQQYVSLRLAQGGRRPDYRPASPSTGGQGGLQNVMLEVRGLAPASDKRMKAIEQAEKVRKKDAEGKTDEFASELNGFVEGKMLKKTGGAEETERIRQLKSEASLKAMFGQSPAPPSSPSTAPAPATRTDPTPPTSAAAAAGNPAVPSSNTSSTMPKEEASSSSSLIDTTISKVPSEGAGSELPAEAADEVGEASETPEQHPEMLSDMISPS